MDRTFTITCCAATLALSGAALAGCGITHRYRLEGFDADRAALTQSAERRVVVVFAPPEFPEIQETGADGHTFVFEDLPSFYERALRSALRERVATVDVVRGAAPPGYDAYLYPSLELRASADLFRKECAATYGLRVEDASHRVLARESSRGERSFVAIASADEACKIAMLSVFDQVTYPVLGAIDRLSQSAGGEAAP